MHHAPLTAAPPALTLTLTLFIKFVMGSLAMKATERDPDFLDNFRAVLGGNKRQTGAAAGMQWRQRAEGSAESRQQPGSAATRLSLPALHGPPLLPQWW